LAEADLGATRAAAEPVTVTAVVSLQPVMEPVVLAGSVVASPICDLVITEAPVSQRPPYKAPEVEEGEAPPPEPPALPKVEKTVVSRQVVGPGDGLAVGSLLAEVSGRPVFAAPPGFPLYRDLVAGMEGEDVWAVQTMLRDLGYFAVNPTGTFGPVTIDALRRFYKDHGYLLPGVEGGVQGLSIQEFLPLPAPGHDSG
jgi:hypothetical protein